MKYQIGTVLQPTNKALKKYPNDFAPEDRFKVTGENAATWFKVTEWRDPFSKRFYKAGETIMAGNDGSGEIRIVQDSLVEEDKTYKLPNQEELK